MHLQTTDENRDGKPDVRIFFDGTEKKERVESDTNFDDRMDTWQVYEEGHVAQLEKDDNGDGKVDLRVDYKNGSREKLVSDADHDGYFEITQWFNRPEWSLVVDHDIDQDGNPDARFFYKDGTLMLKELDEDGDGRVDLREFYEEHGKLIKCEQDAVYNDPQKLDHVLRWIGGPTASMWR